MRMVQKQDSRWQGELQDIQDLERPDHAMGFPPDPRQYGMPGLDGEKEEERKTMSRRTMRKDIARIARHYGLDHQLEKLREEISELDKAILDLLSHGFRDELYLALVDELADVSVVSMEVQDLLGSEDKVRARMAFKVKRQLDRMARGVER